MPDYTPVNTEVQKLIDAAVAAKGVVDAAALQKALADDTAADAAAVKAAADAYAALKAEYDAYKKAHPDPTPVPDTTAPSAPTGLLATAVSSSGISLAWAAATDNVAVTGYIVFRNGVQIGTPTARSFSDGGLTASTAYSYTVKARDAAGNISAASVAASATTQAMTPSTGWPDATNTGAKGTLTVYTGSMNISTAGVTIENKIISGSLRVVGSNFVLKNCKLSTTEWWGIDAEGAVNPTIQDCTFTGPGIAGNGNSAILGSGTFLRNDISKFSNGITLQKGASMVKGNYIHDLAAAGDPHNDGISVQGGQDGVLIEDNRIMSNDTSDIIINNDFGETHNITINHNYLGGQVGYNIYAYANSVGTTTGVKITNNTIERGGYGYFDITRTTPVISGNVKPDGTPI